MYLLNLNLMINNCIQKMILYGLLMGIFHVMDFDFDVKVPNILLSVLMYCSWLIQFLPTFIIILFIFIIEINF